MLTLLEAMSPKTIYLSHMGMTSSVPGSSCCSLIQPHVPGLHMAFHKAWVAASYNPSPGAEIDVTHTWSKQRTRIGQWDSIAEDD